MRDGIKLRTIILIAKGAKDAPMLMDRTPYDASERLKSSNSPHLLAAVLEMTQTAAAEGFIMSRPLRDASHTFLPGHRIMVQVQSSWFPLYDRNPQRHRPARDCQPLTGYAGGGASAN